MRPQSRSNRVAFRRAVWASVALHAVAAFALILFVKSDDQPKPVQRGISTVSDEPQVRMSLTEEAVVNVEPTPVTALKPAIEPPREVEPTQPLVTSRVPPQMLPPEMLAIIRKPTPQPVGGTVTEVPVSPGGPKAVATDPNVKPAGGPSANSSATAIHGALKPSQTVVYVLDCSGSMGAAGKLDAARAALVATLKQQPATVRFQVIVYSGAATPLLTSDGNALPASEANVRAAAEKLATLEARGKSNHLEAVREALAFRPDFVLLLTDANELTAATFKPVLASASRPVAMCVGQVTAGAVQRPRELK